MYLQYIFQKKFLIRNTYTINAHPRLGKAKRRAPSNTEIMVAYQILKRFKNQVA